MSTKDSTMRSKATSYRRQARAVLDKLKEAELRVARDFLQFLRLKHLDRATLEIMTNPQMVEDIRVAREDLRRGRRSRFTPWERVKRDV